MTAFFSAKNVGIQRNGRERRTGWINTEPLVRRFENRGGKELQKAYNRMAGRV